MECSGYTYAVYPPICDAVSAGLLLWQESSETELTAHAIKFIGLIISTYM